MVGGWELSACSRRRRLADAARAAGAPFALRSSPCPWPCPGPCPALSAPCCLQVIRDTVDKPKQLTFKSTTDIVTETDKASEVACIEAIRAAFPTHAILVSGASAARHGRRGMAGGPSSRPSSPLLHPPQGEEGGVTGDVNSDYLWCAQPAAGAAGSAPALACTRWLGDA